MSERGVFAVDRGIFTDDLFADEPLTEREAFLWLVAEASWKPRRSRVGVSVVDLDRGQLCHSVRFMAEAWKWSKSRVDRFLCHLEARDSITRSRGTVTAVVTICRYNEFQRVALPSRDSVAASSGTDAGQPWDKLESIKTLTSSTLSANADDEGRQLALKGTNPAPKNSAKLKPKAKRNDYPQAFEALWGAYPISKNMSKLEAFKAWDRLDGEDQATVMRSIAPFKAWVATQRDYNVIHLERYIRYRRFDGHAAAADEAPQNASSHAAYLAGLSDEKWREHVRDWRATGGRWLLRQRTPPPDAPNTKVPQRILAEFGIARAGGASLELMEVG